MSSRDTTDFRCNPPVKPPVPLLAAGVDEAVPPLLLGR